MNPLIEDTFWGMCKGKIEWEDANQIINSEMKEIKQQDRYKNMIIEHKQKTDKYM